MADKTQDRNADNEVPLEKKLDDLYALIDGIEVAQFTTRRADGHLVSRPMQVQRRTAGSDLWFMTNSRVAQARGARDRPARQLRVLQGPHARVGVGERYRASSATSASSTTSTSPTGARGSATRAASATAAPTTRGSRSCSSTRTR